MAERALRLLFVAAVLSSLVVALPAHPADYVPCRLSLSFLASN